jgi:hypothetical protein
MPKLQSDAKPDMHRRLASMRNGRRGPQGYRHFVWCFLKQCHRD